MRSRERGGEAGGQVYPAPALLKPAVKLSITLPEKNRVTDPRDQKISSSVVVTGPSREDYVVMYML